MSQDSNATKKNTRAGFIIKITSTDNSSWQGTLTWIEKGITKSFRSELELLKLMDSAVEESAEE